MGTVEKFQHETGTLFYIFRRTAWYSLEDRAVILVSPDEDLRDGPERLHQEAAVRLGHRLVAAQDGVEVPAKEEGELHKRILYICPPTTKKGLSYART